MALRVCLSVSLLPAAFSIFCMAPVRNGFFSPSSYPFPICRLLGWWWGVWEFAIVLTVQGFKMGSVVCVCVCVCVCARVFLLFPASPYRRNRTVVTLLGLSQGQGVLPADRGHHLLLLPESQVPECFWPSCSLGGLFVFCFSYSSHKTVAGSPPQPPSPRWRKARSSSSQSLWSLGERLCLLPTPTWKKTRSGSRQGSTPPTLSSSVAAHLLWGSRICSACIRTYWALLARVALATPSLPGCRRPCPVGPFVHRDPLHPCALRTSGNPASCLGFPPSLRCDFILHSACTSSFKFRRSFHSVGSFLILQHGCVRAPVHRSSLS